MFQEAKMALPMGLQKPGKFSAKGESDSQQSDSDTEVVPPSMNESGSWNSIPSVLDRDQDKKSCQAGLIETSGIWVFLLIDPFLNVLTEQSRIKLDP